MSINLYQDWPVYVLLGIAVLFFVYVIIKGNQGERNKENARPTEKESKQ